MYDTNTVKKYIIKKFDTPVLSFKFIRGALTNKIEVDEIFDSARLPMFFHANGVDSETLEQWLNLRKIPANRTFAEEFLAAVGLDEKDIAGILDISKGLSLNDCFWIVEEGFFGTFAQYNLYDNPFSEVLSQIAFTGWGSWKVKKFISCPEFTTGGMLPKCWRRIDDIVYLYKAGTSGYANSGKEPYSEYYASQLTAFLGLPRVGYDLAPWKDKLCSVCELFTSKEVTYIPMGEIIPLKEHSKKIEAVVDYLDGIGGNTGEHIKEQFSDMIFLDALIENTDRHFGNFGLLFNSRTDELIGMAPLFDHGFSLLYHALDSELDNMTQKRIPNTPTPALYNDFFTAAEIFALPKHHAMLRRLLQFNFKPHPVYNVSAFRLNKLNAFVQNRASLLLEILRASLLLEILNRKEHTKLSTLTSAQEK